MKVKEYVAPSLPEALARIRKELGPDAYILSTTTRVRRERPWSREKTTEVVVTAALPREEVGRRLPSSTTLVAPLDAGRPETKGFPGRDLLVSLGWEEEMLAWIEKEWKEVGTSLSGGSWEQTIRPWLAELLLTGVRTSPTWLEPEEPGRVVAFVGPKAAGKSTTVQKVARCYSEIGQWRVKVFDWPVPVDAVASARRGAQLVLLDTPALGPSDQQTAAAWGKEWREAGVSEVHLVLPAFTGGMYARRLVSALAELPLTHLSVTRVEEAGWASVYQLARRVGLPLRFVGTGPADPQELEVADPATLVREVLGELDAGRTRPGDGSITQDHKEAGR